MTFAEQHDFHIREERFDDATIYLVGFNTLIDFTKTTLHVRQMAERFTSVHELFLNLREQLDADASQLKQAVLDGKLVLISENGNNAIMEPVPVYGKSTVRACCSPSVLGYAQYCKRSQSPLWAFHLSSNSKGLRSFCHTFTKRKVAIIFLEMKESTILFQKT
ncbi:hypothetical protein A8990_14225 [Paenibacillus taihuensis]|uniref:GerA spore germination protein n=1 Tax=Paenibacillus taihuensis TaxID=1156355 RepID=A0A3D9R1N0_9BACL|nr:hypothetical protein [Paenibacillus taihuensis]REE67598.1 hypothetical protein A8990_14225 [Paenibacillus taihuensis]